MIHDTRGNIAVIMAFILPAAIVTAGMGMETGYWFLLDRKGQNAADVAAFAGAIALRNTELPEEAENAAYEEADKLGFGSTITDITINTPPQSGAHQNDRSVEVLLTYRAPRFVSPILNADPICQDARAVAEISPPPKACLLALDTSAPRALTLSGTADISLLNCEVMANSFASDALYVSGSAAVLAPCVNAVGMVDVSGGGSQLSLANCNTPRTELARALDPYRDLTMLETMPTCENLPNGNTPSTITAGSDGVRRFCGGLTVKSDTFFGPGVYIVDGGTFRINSNLNVAGDDVTFIMTGGAEIFFNGSATIQLSAPTSGDYAGVLFYGDPDDVDAEHTFNGSADSLMTGTLYTPSSKLKFLGNFSGEDGCMQLIGGTVELSGTINIESDCDAYAIKWVNVPSHVRLVE